MRIAINLATEPYEDARRFARFWGLALGGIALVTALLVYGALANWHTSRVEARTLQAEREVLARYEAQEAAAMAILNRPENRDVRTRSQLINGLIRRKQFSWTLIFADLERLMPPRLHVLSISPLVDKSNQIIVNMTVAGDSRDRAVELVQNMEKSRSFRYPEVLSESNAVNLGQNRGPTTDGIRFDIRAQYVPDTERGSGD